MISYLCQDSRDTKSMLFGLLLAKVVGRKLSWIKRYRHNYMTSVYKDLESAKKKYKDLEKVVNFHECSID